MVTKTKSFENSGVTYYSVTTIIERWKRQGRPGASRDAVHALIYEKRLPASKFGGAWFIALDALKKFEDEPHNMEGRRVP